MFHPISMDSIRKKFGAPKGVLTTPGAVAQGGNQGRMQDVRRSMLAKTTGGPNMQGSAAAPGTAGSGAANRNPGQSQGTPGLNRNPMTGLPNSTVASPIPAPPKITAPNPLTQTPNMKLPRLTAIDPLYQDGEYTWNRAELQSDRAKADAAFRRGVTEANLNYGMGVNQLERATISDSYADHSDFAARGIASGGMVNKSDLDRVQDKSDAMKTLEAKYGKDAVREMLIDREIERQRIALQNAGMSSTALQRYNANNPATPRAEEK